MEHLQMAINTGLSKILGEKIGVTRVTSISLKAKDIVQLAIIEIRFHFVIKFKESTNPDFALKQNQDRQFLPKIQILAKIYKSFINTTLFRSHIDAT